MLAWVGLWFPLDVILFSPHQYNRENGSLRVLRNATIRLEADGTVPGEFASADPGQPSH